jgi:glycosyltransferase involved in cell wall biosynthesis
MHVLFLPKWYPGRNDPQLGDFLRKQALAVAQRTRMSVLFVSPLVGEGSRDEQEVTEEAGLWELRCYYRASAHPWRPWRKLVNLRRYWKAAMAGWERVLRERGRPDLTHAYILVRPVLVARRLERVHGIPYLISEQSSEYLDGTYASKGPLFAALNRWLFRHAAAVTAVSTWLGDKLVELGLCTRYDVVPNVVPGLDRPLPAAGEAGHFLVVADLVDRTKNVSGVIRALAKARAEDPRLRLTVIGDGPDRAELSALASSLGLNGHVKFLGRLPNSAVLDHMAHASAVVINSNVETFSVVTGEALALGKPVIATRCGGPVAFVTENNGTLIPVQDDEALRTAMLAMSSSGAYTPADIRASVSGKFSPEAVGQGFLRVYERILADARA